MRVPGEVTVLLQKAGYCPHIALRAFLQDGDTYTIW